MNTFNPSNSNSENETQGVVYQSKIYQEYCRKRDEILKYKWIESEKAGKDIGMDKAWLQWEAKYYKKWKTSESETSPQSQDRKPNESSHNHSASTGQ